MFRKLLATLALAMCATIAFAIPKPSEVKEQVLAGNYPKAESMLKEVIAEHPIAVVHYQLGQVYAKEGRHPEALNEYRQAQALDPTLKFASSAEIFTRGLMDEQAIVSSAPIVQTSIPFHSTPQKESSTAGIGFVGGFVIVLFLVGIIWGVILFSNKRSKAKEQTEIDDDTKNKTATLLNLAKQLEDATLIAKTASYDDTMRITVLNRISGIQSSVRGAIADLKDGRTVTNGRIQNFENYVQQATEEAANGVVAPLAESGSVVNVHTGGYRSTRYDPAPGYSEPAVSHPHYTPAPAPVYVNNNSGDLVTGMMIGSMMNNHSDRTVYVERDREEYSTPAPRSIKVPPERSYDNGSSSDDSYRSNDTSSYDSGSSSSDSYSSSNDTSSYDSGSSSSDSY